jgi:hypothetical protein
MPSQHNDSANSAGPLASVSNAVNLLAPLTVAFTGMLYLAGWTYRARMISPFGLRSYMLEYSLQDTLALGYTPVFVGTLIIFLLFISVGTIGLLMQDSRFARRFSKVRISAWGRFNAMLFGTALLLSYGYIAGNILGKRSADKIRGVVQEGCKTDCQVYFIGSQGITGRLIAQDKSRMIILTKAGVVLIKNEDLTRVVPIGSNSDYIVI